jgi:hypothetical protein
MTSKWRRRRVVGRWRNLCVPGASDQAIVVDEDEAGVWKLMPERTPGWSGIEKTKATGI